MEQTKQTIIEQPQLENIRAVEEYINSNPKKLVTLRDSRKVNVDRLYNVIVGGH